MLLAVAMLIAGLAGGVALERLVLNDDDDGQDTPPTSVPEFVTAPSVHTPVPSTPSPRAETATPARVVTATPAAASTPVPAAGRTQEPVVIPTAPGPAAP